MWRGPPEEAKVLPPAGWPPPARRGRTSSQKPGQLGPGDSGDEPGPPYRVSSRSPQGERLALVYGNAREGCSKTFMKLLLHFIFLEAN